MVRAERRVLLTSESLVRVSAGAPGSGPQPEGEILTARAGRRKPVKEQGARKRAATLSERCRHGIFSAERCWKGPSRSCHGEGNRQQSGPERLLDLSGVWGGGTFPEKSAEQARPYLAAKSGKDRAYKTGGLKAIINIQPHATRVNPHPISAGIPAAAQTRSYLLRSGSHLSLAGQYLPK